MLRRRWKFFSFVVIFVLVLGFGAHAVLAASSGCYKTENFHGHWVRSCKQNYKYGTSYWKGRMISQVTSGGSVAKIGWHSWTDTTYCNGRPYSLSDFGSSYGYNRTYWASTSWAHVIPYCGRVATSVYGKHYWAVPGDSHTQSWSLWNRVR